MSSRQFFRLAGAAFALLAATGTALAQKGTLEVRSEVFREVVSTAADGTRSTRTVPAPHAAPGQEVTYVTTIRNVGSQAADHLVINNPVPAELTYKGSAGDPSTDTQVSLDGKDFAHLESLQQKGADGVSRQAEAADVRFLRWTLSHPIKPGESFSVSYHAIVR